MPLAALVLVPAAGAGFAFATMRFVSGAGSLTGAARERATRQARWTAAATWAALLVVGLLLRTGG